MNASQLRIATVIAIACSAFFAAGAARAETQLMILLDSSGSMAAPGIPGTSHNKLDEANAAVSGLLQKLPAEISVGLRVMGGTPSADCYTTFLYFEPSQGIRSQIQDYIDTLRPSGARALYQGIEDCMTDLGASAVGIDRVMLVVTDGGDDCGRDFDPLAEIYSYDPSMPRIVIYGLDLSQSDKLALGELVASTGGRVTNVEDLSGLSDALVKFGEEFANNLRIHLMDNGGNSVQGDVVVRNTDTGQIVAERLDSTDLSINVGPGNYEITGRYLGQEVKSDAFVMVEGDSRTVDLKFEVYLATFVLSLRDVYDQPLRARVTFINSSNEPVLTTGVDAHHRVELPPDTYSIQVRVGDFVQDIGGIQIGPSYEDTVEIELPVELGTLEVEVANMYATPLNAEVSIFDQDGSLMDSAPSTSYLYSRLPPGTYRVVAKFQDIEVEQSVYLNSGEQRQIGLEMNVAIGDIFVKLRTESDNDVWGWVKVYDNNGNLIERFSRERIESPDWSITDLPVGIYRIEAEAEGVVRTMSGIEVKENEETEVVITFPDEVY